MSTQSVFISGNYVTEPILGPGYSGEQNNNHHIPEAYTAVLDRDAEILHIKFTLFFLHLVTDVK